MLNASVLSDDPATNLQLALGVELSVLPPYLYALWSIKSRADGASNAAVEAANSIRAVVYEEMLHAGLVGNILNALGVRPQVSEHLMSYPGPLPGHTTDPPYAYDVGLGPLSPTTVATFLRIELPEWDAPRDRGPWITIAELYDEVK
ncbi:MAG: ferritin-like domain-containing protein, partial [Solirubrobacteraceae bacterium]